MLKNRVRRAGSEVFLMPLDAARREIKVPLLVASLDRMVLVPIARTMETVLAESGRAAQNCNIVSVAAAQRAATVCLERVLHPPGLVKRPRA